MPDSLTSTFYTDPDLDSRWRAYLRKGYLRSSPPASMSQVGTRIIGFLGPVRGTHTPAEGKDGV
jgi:hypothetical protein